MRFGFLTSLFSLILPALSLASEPVWVFIEPPSEQAERAFENGRQAAKADIASDLLKVGASGMSPDPERTRLLARFGIQEVGAGCLVNRGDVYGRIYFETFAKEIERRYGPDFWQSFEAELAQIKEADAVRTEVAAAADLKFRRAVADHIGSHWKMPADVPSGRRCSTIIQFDEEWVAADWHFASCVDAGSAFEESITQAVQASLPLPRELAKLRTSAPVVITFAIP